ITSSVNSRERSGINTILHELNPLFTINVTMRDIKSKNVYSRVNSKATTQWRKTESANGVHLEGAASDDRRSSQGNKPTNLTSKEAKMGRVMRHTLGADRKASSRQTRLIAGLAEGLTQQVRTD